jgi:TRAP-type C4-dicarboxylate transport system permease small subunit
MSCPEGSKKVLRTISDTVVFAFAVGMIFFGWQLVVLQWNERMPSLGISGSFRYVPLVAGGALIALFSAERILLRWSGVDVDQDIHENDELLTVHPVKEL